MRRYKLKNRKRFYSVIAVFVTLIFLGLILITSESVLGDNLQKYDYVTVQNGDTLWEIAAKYNDSKYNDLREFVYVIKKENGIFGDTLVPNQSLKIPKA